MTFSKRVNGSESGIVTKGFYYLDRHNETVLAPRRGEIALYGGRCSITNAVILETPQSVRQAGEIITNPAQLGYDRVTINGETQVIPTFWGRRERAHRHLGTTRAHKYALLNRPDGTRYISEFAGADEALGEDPRLTRGVRMKGHLGVHAGDLLSVIEAMPVPGKPEEVSYIQPVFLWAPRQTPKKLEVVGHGPRGVKNINPFTLYSSDDDTRLGGIARPHPTMSYFEVADPTGLAPEAIESAKVLPKLLPKDSPVKYHLGGNVVTRVAPNRVRINSHQAWVDRPDGNLAVLHYRLADYGYELPSREASHGYSVSLGVTAMRSQFPAVPPKAPEGGVASFDDVVYGSVNGHAIMGVADNYIGFADSVYIM